MNAKLLFLTAAFVATSAMAQDASFKKDPPAPSPSPTPEACDLCAHDIVLKGPTIQVTALKNTASIAWASGADSKAVNNMSSNTSGVLIDQGVESTQITALKNSGVLAYASASDSYANNNLASNVGSVGVGADQLQIVLGKGAFLAAKATGTGSRAVQNFSSNNACLTCE